MDGKANATSAASGNQRNAPPSTADAQRQGEAAGRQVTVVPAGSPGFSTRESGCAAGDSAHGAAQRDIRSRFATALTLAADEPGPSVGSGSGSGEAASGGVVNGADRAPGSTGSDLPWLTPDQFADLQAKRRRLNELKEQAQSPQVRDDLELAIGAVDMAEEKIESAHRLLKTSRSQALSADEWRELYYALDSGKRDLPGLQGLLNAGLGRLASSDAFSPEDAGLVNDLQKRFDDVHDYLRSSGPAWRCLTRPIRTTIPAGARRPLAVESHRMPGNVLRVHIGSGKLTDTAEGAAPGARYFQVPGLTLTGLTNARGQMLYTGLRQGLLHAGELDGALLARLPDDELYSALMGYRQCLFARIYAEIASARQDEMADEQARADCSRIRKLSGGDLEDWAHRLKQEAGLITLTELITAAVYANPEHLGKALGGGRFVVKFLSIALLTPADVALWHGRPEGSLHGASFGLAIGQPDEQGHENEFTAIAEFRQCVLSPVEERLCSDGGDGAGRQAAERLLGPLDDARLGGDVGAAVAAIEARASRSLDELDECRRRHALTAGESGNDHPLSLMVARQLSRLQADTQRLHKDACTLKGAGTQLKAMWDRDGWPSSPDACIQAAARLALVGHLTGEMPLLSCASGRDFTQRVEQEVQYLAAVADADNGQLPPVDPDLSVCSEVRQAFAHPPSLLDEASSRPGPG